MFAKKQDISRLFVISHPTSILQSPRFRLMLVIRLKQLVSVSKKQRKQHSFPFPSKFIVASYYELAGPPTAHSANYIKN